MTTNSKRYTVLNAAGEKVSVTVPENNGTECFELDVYAARIAREALVERACAMRERLAKPRGAYGETMWAHMHRQMWALERAIAALDV